jgi:hypothetical protein
MVVLAISTALSQKVGQADYAGVHRTPKEGAKEAFAAFISATFPFRLIDYLD